MEKKIKIFHNIHKMTAGIAFASIVLPILFWKQIPETIPMHFNEVGVIDNWSDKSSLILLFFVVLLVLGMMWIVEYFVRSSGLSVHASDSERQNLQTLYPTLVIMNLFLQCMFAYMIFCSITCRPLGTFFLPISLVAIFAPLGWYIFKYYRMGKASRKEKKAYQEREKSKTEQGVVYRTKIDIWLGVFLGWAWVSTLWAAIDSIWKGTPSLLLIGTAIFVTLIVVPMFFIRYTLYTDYILIDCLILGKERIFYKNITKIQKTYNPLSSAAMSLKRVQIDYTVNGTHQMALISPIRREEFIKEVEKRRG